MFEGRFFSDTGHLRQSKKRVVYFDLFESDKGKTK